MIITFIIVLLAVFGLIYLARLTRGRTTANHSSADLRAGLRPLDLQAFRNLTDPAEDEYLRSALSRANYRRARRDRLRATLAYVSCAADNAAVLIRLGDAARLSPDPAVTEAAEKLVNSAIRLRLFAFQAAFRLHLGIVLPVVPNAANHLAERYELVTRQGLLLGRMQYPGRGGSVTV